jgi:signal transduction histidine kinase
VVKLKALLSQHVIWVVLVAVMVPLLIILMVQYRSLVELERTLPIANKAWMRKYLVTLASQVEETYRTGAEETLSVPREAFLKGVKEKKWDEVIAHFESRPAKGARRLFIGFTGMMGKDEFSLILFYSPASSTCGGGFIRETGSVQWRAAHGASATWLYHGLTGGAALSGSATKASIMTVDERDPENRIITRPVLGDDFKVIGVVGMILDDSYLRNEAIPRTIASSLPEFFPDDQEKITVALHDGGGDRLFSTHPVSGHKYEAAEPLQFIFKDWYLKIQSRGMTGEEDAKRVFALNLSLTVLMTLLVIGGIIMALRTASREMRLSRMKADFVSNVSHELRTPLASIRVFGEFFKLGWVKEPEKIQEYGGYIENESRRLTQLVNNILDFSRIESGGKTYQFEQADLKDVVVETLRAFDVRLGQTGFSLDLKVPDEPLVALVNRDAITQLLMNLLDNAIKYSGSSNKILVQAGRKEGQISISVTDYGVGIPREEREKIFDKFYRVSTGLVHDVKGSGLGLSIVKHIVEAHKGKITVESQPGAGSTFTLLFPSVEDFNAKNAREKSAQAPEPNLPVRVN